MEHLKWEHIENPAITNFEYKVETFAENGRILSADANGFRLRVFERQIKTEKFGEYVKNSVDMLQGFYKQFESPYPAPLSQEVACTDALKPRALPKINTADRLTVGLILYANSRYTYGDCDPNELQFETLQAFIHCPRANVSYEIKYFIPKSQASPKILESVYTSLTCI